MSLRLRLLPYTVEGGPVQMAQDESLLEAAVQGQASLRFYQWSEPTLSLGYFQPVAMRQQLPAASTLPYVRRPTGGAAIVHHHELTYAFALPPRLAFRQTSWICLFHQLLAEVVAPVFAPGQLHLVACGQERKLGEILCFLHHSAGDLLLQDNKIAGSAQRKHRGALLQHGSILLRRSPYAPQLPGIFDLAGREFSTPTALAEQLARRFAQQLHAELYPDTWTTAEQQRIQQLLAEKYTQPAWNDKR
ncbi:MAG: lipoate--protein ligase family protein [Gemmataceae bacterium]|nr:lipoate--protein ligase family protein [Gemmataceae bacterium]MCS7270915.1 lipoate--protein ligase family protein [Gemmataceae bacterium]MDW8243137.1 lipoate--protein ligase family protein [Thermogemmata sp.]